MSRLERGFVGSLSVGTLRSILAVLEIRLDLSPRWRGPDLDRLLDEAHAHLGAHVARALERRGWEAAVEVTYSVYGERGSIDILAVHPPSSTALVVAVKSQLVSAEETIRRIDQKQRLGRQIAFERFGWRPRTVGRLLVLPGTVTERRRWARHGLLLDRAFPVSGGARVRKWLTAPAEGFSGVWFVSSSHPRTPRSIRRPRLRPGSYSRGR